MNPFEAIQGRDFDCIAPSITCRVDRGGASVYSIALSTREVRVLAHTEEEARNAAVDHVYSAGLLNDEPDLTQPLF